MSDFEKLLEAIDPEEVFKPASEEELLQRPEDTETYEMTIGSHVYQLTHYSESGRTELVAKEDDTVADFKLVTFSRGRAEVPDGLALLDFLQEVMTEHGEDVTDGV